MGIFDFEVVKKDGSKVSISEYKGKVILVVNTATGCGFTPQYKALEELYNKYKEEFVILDFPCNQFGNQASGSDKDITQFCQLNYGVSFPQFKKVDVNGSNEEPFFTYLKAKKPGLFSKKIKWNFTKFLVDKDGKVIKRYAPATKPENIEEDIKKLLG